MTDKSHLQKVIIDLLRIVWVARKEQTYWKVNEAISDLYEKYPEIKELIEKQLTNRR